MKRIGFVAMALILALGALGVGFASWIDTVTIDGTVKTGSVDLDIVKVSGTWVYKHVASHGILVEHLDNEPDPGEGYVEIASAEATFTEDPNVITVTTSNMFPMGDEYFMIDILLHYDGSIPARISSLDVDAEGFPLVEKLWNEGHAYYRVFESDETGYQGQEISCSFVEGFQMHFCEYYLIWLILDVPQEFTDLTSTQNIDGEFTANIDVIQWNEYGPD